MLLELLIITAVFGTQSYFLQLVLLGIFIKFVKNHHHHEYACRITKSAQAKAFNQSKWPYVF